MSPITHYFVDQTGQVSLPIIDKDNWRPSTKIADVLKSLFVTFQATREKRLKADLQDLRDEALVNDTIRNILIDENYLNEWRFSIYPRDLPFNVASFGILINFPGTLN